MSKLSDGLPHPFFFSPRLIHRDDDGWSVLQGTKSTLSPLSMCQHCFVKAHAARSDRLLCPRVICANDNGPRNISKCYSWLLPAERPDDALIPSYFSRDRGPRSPATGSPFANQEAPGDLKMMWRVKWCYRTIFTGRDWPYFPNGSLIWVDRSTVGSPASTIMHLTGK